MDSGLEERILPSIRRSQILLIYCDGGVDNPETFGQIMCAAGLSEGWRPAVRSRARSGDYPSVSRWAQAARSGWVQVETFGQIACAAGTPARSETTRRPAVRSRARSGDRHDREEVQAARSERWGCVDNFDCFRADTGVCPYAFKYPEVGVTPRGYPPALAAM